MAIGDLSEVRIADSTALYYLDTGMYGTAEYGTVYILDAERPALVDTGTGASYELVLSALADVGIAPEDLSVIALTHVHLDHAGGAGHLLAECPNATVAVHEVGAPHVVDPDRLVEGTKRAVGDQWEFYAEPVPVPEDRLRVLTDGDVLDLGDHELRAHYAPGHAPHQVVYEDPANDAVFTADAAGIYVPAHDAVNHSTPPSNFDLEGALADVETIRDIDPAVLCFGHFGPAPTGDLLAEYADVLPAWVDRVARKRAELDEDEAVVEYFGERARFGDVWGQRRARAEERINVRGVLRYLDQRSAADDGE